MIAELIQVLNTAAETLPVDTRHGWAQVIEGRPRVHVGAGQWVDVAQDTNGTWSYVRVNGQARVEPVDIGEPCSGVKVRLPFRLVALLDRSACDELPGLLVQTAASIRQARKQFVAASSAVNVLFPSVLWQVGGFESQEFQPVPAIPADKVLVAIDVLMEVDGREDCFQGCGVLTDVVCKIIERASLDKIRECLGERIEQLCDIPPPVCPDTTVNGEVSETPVITVLQGGVPVGTLDPVTGVVTIEECEPGCTEPLVIEIEFGEMTVQVASIADPCDETFSMDCDTPTDAVYVEGCGCVVANTVYAPNGVGGYQTLPGQDRELVPTGPLPAQWEVRVVPSGTVFYRTVGTHSSPIGVTDWVVVSGPGDAPTNVRVATVPEVFKVLCGGCPVKWGLRDTNGLLLESAVLENPCEQDTLNIVAPDATVTRDGQPFGTVVSGGTIDVPSDCPPPEPCPDLCDLLGEEDDAEELATTLENCLPEGVFDELKDEICDPSDLCDLLGEVAPEDIKEDVLDCLDCDQKIAAVNSLVFFERSAITCMETEFQTWDLMLWLDGLDTATLFDATSGGSLPAIGAGVARWEDKSGNGYHVTQATPGQQPARRLTGLEFDGNNDILVRSTATNLLRNVSGGTLVSMLRRTALVSGLDSFFGHLVGAPLTTARTLFGFNGSNQIRAGGRRLDADSLNTADGGTAINTVEPLIAMARFDYAGDRLDVYARDVVTPQASNTSFQTASTGQNTSNTQSESLTIGASSAIAQNSAFLMQTMMLFHTALTQTQREFLKRYLLLKYPAIP